MDSISHLMTDDHRRCDHLFAEAEQQVANKNWELAGKNAHAFNAAILHHFQHEESTLFPAFEKATGMQGGPTHMMRHEHEQMRQLLAELMDAIDAQNQDRYLGLSETLLIFMQQHNMKEEQILYPMIDQECAEDSEQLMAGLHSTPENSNAA
ncbi:MAG: hemerythrin domain-containing protein [Gammaproteobacteria bacterium]|nr:hemerythrin domain-containing protein [Gammaproteobacteria bacterium]